MKRLTLETDLFLGTDLIFPKLLATIRVERVSSVVIRVERVSSVVIRVERVYSVVIGFETGFRVKLTL